jgi:hypothetical protein
MGVIQTNRKGSGSGGFIFTQDIPVNLTGGGRLGKYPSGTNIPAIGKNPQEVWLDVASEYLPPAFTAFTMSGQATAVEVGTTIAGARTFTWSTSNPANVQASSIKITDLTNNTDLVTGLSNDGSESVNVGSISKNTLATHSWRASGNNTNAQAFNSNNFTVEWQFRRYIGTSNNAVLTEAQIEALALNTIANTRNGTYALAAGGYKYLCWPDSYGSPTAGTGIRDTATGFPVSMADGSDDVFFSNTQNGWPYGLVSVTNALGVTTNYRVYRSKNILGGSINIQIS